MPSIVQIIDNTSSLRVEKSPPITELTIMSKDEIVPSSLDPVDNLIP